MAPEGRITTWVPMRVTEMADAGADAGGTGGLPSAGCGFTTTPLVEGGWLREHGHKVRASAHVEKFAC
jgi:hypothetical protein